MAVVQYARATLRNVWLFKSLANRKWCLQEQIKLQIINFMGAKCVHPKYVPKKENACSIQFLVPLYELEPIKVSVINKININKMPIFLPSAIK